MSAAALSQTLKSITGLKISELEKQRKSYESHKKNTINYAEQPDIDYRQRVSRLLEGVEQIDPVPVSKVDLSNVRRWLDQSEYDASIPDTLLVDFEKQLRSQLDIQSRRLDLAHLYSRLLSEWLKPSLPVQKQTTHTDDVSLDEPFEFVEKDRLRQLKEKFEAVVFSPHETDEVEIDNYLLDLFQGDNGEKALERLRDGVKRKSNLIFKNKKPFVDRTITWCLKGLLGNDLLSDDKKVILQEFLQDEVSRAEICDVLNMKFADLDNWAWDAGEEGMPVEPRRQLNGKYRIMTDEDILQAIFLHFIGMTWSSFIKATLKEVARDTSLWKRSGRAPLSEIDKQLFFLGDRGQTYNNIEENRYNDYQDDFLLSQLPSTVYENAGGYDDDEDLGDDANSSRKSPKEIKQQLLRQLATEMHLRKSLDGEYAVVQSDFQWFATSIPHSSIFAVLRFMGVPQKWIGFFKKFLEAPLNLAPVSDDRMAGNRVQIRRRGVPMAHALEKFLTESVLFFMDVAVNQESEMLLYRFHDDLWLCGQPEKCSEAWQSMERFAAIMGLEFNRKKTGSVYFTNNTENEGHEEKIRAILPKGTVSIGFLVLDPCGEWVIDQVQVDAHVSQLQKQLAKCDSILSWVQTWNSCIGRFFSHTFGEPANCFGRSHVDRILETYQAMQKTIFGDSNVTKYVKGLISERFGITDVPDAFLFVPEQLGGLGLLNPFIQPLLVREEVCERPEDMIPQAIAAQEEGYKAAKQEFEELSEKERRERYRKIYSDYSSSEPTTDFDSNAFPAFKELKRWEESRSAYLAQAYKRLMDVPGQESIVLSRKVKDAIDQIARTQPELSRYSLDSEKEWILQFHSEELFEKCGGLSIIERNLLPLGILKILRRRKVAWQMVL